MFQYVQKFTLMVLLWGCTAPALEKDALCLQGHVGLCRPLSPQFVTAHWGSSVDFSGGFGVFFEKGALFFSYTNQVFNIKNGIIADGPSASGHIVMLNYKRFLRRSTLSPFYQISGGYNMLQTPALYKESDLIPGMIDEEKQLEDAHSLDGLIVGLGVGLNFELSESALFFLELFGASSLSRSVFSTLGARSGVIFQIGN